MRDKIDAILEQVADPDAPWVWLPTDTEPELWDHLVTAARKAGVQVIDLDHERDIRTQQDLLTAFREQIDQPTWTGSSMNALKDTLVGLQNEPNCWAIVLRNPDFLAEDDPETFEDLLDVVEAANEARRKCPITLITLDAEEEE